MKHHVIDDPSQRIGLNTPIRQLMLACVASWSRGPTGIAHEAWTPATHI